MGWVYFSIKSGTYDLIYCFPVIMGILCFDVLRNIPYQHYAIKTRQTGFTLIYPPLRIFIFVFIFVMGIFIKKDKKLLKTLLTKRFFSDIMSQSWGRESVTYPIIYLGVAQLGARYLGVTMTARPIVDQLRHTRSSFNLILELYWIIKFLMIQ